MATNVKTKFDIRPFLDKIVYRSNLRDLTDNQGLKRHIIILRLMLLILCLVISGMTLYIIWSG